MIRVHCVTVAQEEEDISPNQVLHQVRKGKAIFVN